jgi:hypothetical protein
MWIVCSDVSCQCSSTSLSRLLTLGRSSNNERKQKEQQQEVTAKPAAQTEVVRPCDVDSMSPVTQPSQHNITKVRSPADIVNLQAFVTACTSHLNQKRNLQNPMQEHLHSSNVGHLDVPQVRNEGDEDRALPTVAVTMLDRADAAGSPTSLEAQQPSAASQ